MGERLGQHFLYDEDTLDKIVELARLDTDSVVLEVGPGKADLTRKLAGVAKKVIAVEYDNDLAHQLQTSLNIDNVEIIQQDILEFDLSTLDNDYSVVANIPYYLTSKLIKRLLGAENSPRRLVLLIQKEVAQRLAAKPGQMSVLAISAQMYGQVTLGPVVVSEMFDPPPKVDSQVVVIDVSADTNPDIDNKKFFRLVKAGFGERRKKLTNSLGGGFGVESGQIKTALDSCNLPDTARAQELSLEDWYNLYEVFLEKGLL